MKSKPGENGLGLQHGGVIDLQSSVERNNEIAYCSLCELLPSRMTESDSGAGPFKVLIHYQALLYDRETLTSLSDSVLFLIGI